MQWTHPEMQGDLPPPCRAHSATLVGRKIVIIGGGENASYYNSVHVFDIPTRRWSRPTFTTTDVPPPRRAHTTVLYQNKIWVFGGGNGLQALNDVWTLDVSGSLDRMRWEQVAISGRKRPSPRGYHTANLVQNVMIVVGGSDGRECFQDIWCLNLGASRRSCSSSSHPNNDQTHQTQQFGPKSNPTRYTAAYRTRRHK
jgi:UDP-N-acetylglucosamine:LPS N-acetylglucosamine transferase